MKKILLIVLAIALVLSLCAGCNNSSRIVDDDFDDGPIVIGGTSDDNSGDKPDDDSGDKPGDNSNGDDDKPIGEAPDGWPSGIPPYPDGIITRLESEELDKYNITIENTSKAKVEEYADTLSNAGWECTRDSDEDSRRSFMFNKENFNVSLLLVEDGMTLLINYYRILDKEELPKVWPVDYLPKGFPEYPDGDITRVRVDESGSIYINIEESSIESFDKYAATFRDDGWEFESVGEDNEKMVYWYIAKGDTRATLFLFVPDGSVDINVY